MNDKIEEIKRLKGEAFLNRILSDILSGEYVPDYFVFANFHNITRKYKLTKSLKNKYLCFTLTTISKLNAAEIHRKYFTDRSDRMVRRYIKEIKDIFETRNIPEFEKIKSELKEIENVLIKSYNYERQ